MQSRVQCLCVANVLVGTVFLIVGAVYLAKEIDKRDSFHLVDCRFVASSTIPARCPRLEYDGCGCDLVFTYCDDVEPNSDKSYCCSGTCTQRYYSRGHWRTSYRDKQYRVTYVRCEKVRMIFEIAGKNESYSYFCDQGVRLPKQENELCESLYEDRTQCYFDGSEIRMADPYHPETVIWSSIFIALGGLLVLVTTALFVYNRVDWRGRVERAKRSVASFWEH